MSSSCTVVNDKLGVNMTIRITLRRGEKRDRSESLAELLEHDPPTQAA